MAGPSPPTVDLVEALPLEDFGRDSLPDEAQRLVGPRGPIPIVALSATQVKRVKRHAAKGEIFIEFVRLLVKAVDSGLGDLVVKLGQRSRPSTVS